jgi:hypothetical protein
MTTRRALDAIRLGGLALAAALASAGPAAAEIRLERVDMIAGPLVVMGHVTPAATVTLDVGLETVVIQPDRRGRFVWIADGAPLGCVIVMSRGLERLVAPVGGCGRMLEPPTEPPTMIIDSASGSGSGGADPRAAGRQR